MRLSLFGSGAGSTVAAILDAVADGRIAADPALVISNNSGAGVLAIAAAHGVPIAHLSGATHPDPDDLDAAILAALVDAGTDLVVLAGYMKLLGPRALQHFAGRVVNVHPALLPAYGGQGMYGDRVHAAVLADGATVTGRACTSSPRSTTRGRCSRRSRCRCCRATRSRPCGPGCRRPRRRCSSSWLGEWSRG